MSNLGVKKENPTASCAAQEVVSAIDWLYGAYTDCQECDTEEIQRGFRELGEQLEPLGLDQNNAIFSVVCRLCNAYEKRAFKDAFRLGGKPHNGAARVQKRLCNNTRVKSIGVN